MADLPPLLSKRGLGDNTPMSPSEGRGKKSRHIKEGKENRKHRQKRKHKHRDQESEVDVPETATAAASVSEFSQPSPHLHPRTPSPIQNSQESTIFSQWSSETKSPRLSRSSEVFNTGVGTEDAGSEKGSGAEEVVALLQLLRGEICGLEERRRADETRSAIRHDVIFAALKKLAKEVSTLRCGQDVDAVSPETNNKAGRENLERLLALFLKDMNVAATERTVAKAGSLYSKYSEDLFRYF